MAYVFDTNSFIVLSHYYKDQFLSLWKQIDSLVEAGEIISVKEVLREIESYSGESDLTNWVKKNKNIFKAMSEEESRIISEIFAKYPKFQNMITKKAQLKGTPVADPFIVVKAIHTRSTVVSQETFQKDGIKIPNLCKIQNVRCLKLKEFMKEQNWRF